MKILKELFENNIVRVSKDFELEKSDLYIYLKALYKKEPKIMNYGFLKITEEDNHYVLSEHIFYDYQEDKKVIGYIGFEELPEHSNIITNTKEGLELSQKGFIVFNTNEEHKKILDRYHSLPYTLTPIEEGLKEPEGTFKFNKTIWGGGVPEELSNEKFIFDGLKQTILSKIKFSHFLTKLNNFDANILRWKKGRSMDAHNGVDYRSFVNLITYNTDHCEKTRDITMGEFDWYDVTFQSILQNNFDDLMEINQGKKEILNHNVSTESAVLINVFNPKFYHQVGKYTGNSPLYVCTANMSYREITKDIEFLW